MTDTTKMIRIVDLPEGGGTRRGQDVWFRVSDRDGETTTFCLDATLMTPFIDGMRYFASEAAKLRGETSALEEVRPVSVSQVTCANENGLLKIVLEDAERQPSVFQLDPSKVKQLLVQVLGALPTSLASKSSSPAPSGPVVANTRTETLFL